METTVKAALTLRIGIVTMIAMAAPCIAQSAEHRGLWAFAWGPGFKNASEVSNVVSRAKLANCNVIVAQVRKVGDAYYFPTRPNRDIRASDITAGYDPLLELCTQAHDQGLQVYAWVAVQRVATVWPSDPGHMLNRHPDWLTKTITGGTSFGEGYYADPGNPGAAQWNYNVCMDLVLNYPIDGLVFDLIRYPQQNSGYNETALDRFRARYGYPGSYVPNYTDGLWSAWRREQVTHFVRKVYANAIAAGPEIVIGAATISDRNEAYTYRFQDWRTWMMSGFLDCNYPMTYTSNNTIFNSRVGEAVANSGGRHVYVLQGSYMNSISNTMTQFGLVRSNGAPGMGIYRYCYTYNGDPNTSADDEPAFYSALTSQVFTSPVLTPSMSWKTSPTVGHVKGVAIDADQGIGVDAAWVTAVPTGGGGGVGTYSDGTGFYAHLNLDPGTYNISVSKSGYSMQTEQVTITAGTVETLDFLMAGTVVDSIAGAKQLPDGSGAGMPLMTVTAGNNQLLGGFYVEDADRVSGILVQLPPDSDVLVHPGDAVRVYGALGTASHGARQITNPVVYVVSLGGGQIDPMEIRGRELGGESLGPFTSGVEDAVGPNNIGLLVETVGKVTDVDYTNGWFYINDGSDVNDGTGPLGIRVIYVGLADGNSITPPLADSYVRLRGISSCVELSGDLYRALKLREQSDVTVDTGQMLHAPAGTLLDLWNLIAIPSTPRYSPPADVFGSIPIDGLLYRWDAPSQSLVTYDAWSPESFGNIMRADGYWLLTAGPQPLDLQAYSNSSTDFWLALPESGWTLVGNPFAIDRVWDDTFVTNALETVSLTTAAKTQGWLDSIGYWWDNSSQSLFDIGLMEDFSSTNVLQAWHGYWIRSHTDKIALIFQ